MTRPSPPTLEDLQVRTPDDATFTLRVSPAADPTAPVVLVLPAMAMKAKFYRPLLAALTGAGLSAVSTDLRGQGEATPALSPQSRFGYREIIETDLPAVVDAVTERFPDAPLHLLGHSLGGQVALLYTARHPERVASLTVIATGSVWWRTFGPRWFEVLWKVQVMGLLTRYRGHWPGGMVIPGPVSGPLMTDWVRHSRTGRYRPAGSSVPYDELLDRLDAPVLSISLADDPLGPVSTIDFLARRLRAARVTRLHLDAEHGVAKPGHFEWIRDSATVARAVADWIHTGRVAGAA